MDSFPVNGSMMDLKTKAIPGPSCLRVSFFPSFMFFSPAARGSGKKFAMSSMSSVTPMSLAALPARTIPAI